MGHVAVDRHWERVAMDLLGHVDYIREGESLCAGDGGLFLLVDGGLSVAGQDCHFGGGCFLQ